MKTQHEFRDPLYAFIKVTSQERKVIDSVPFQRLRHIHQLALTSLIYPGATHKRFEHSLGTMELATRVFDTITNGKNIHPIIRELDIVPHEDFGFEYWRKVLRMAALCHDIGHLPFSHAGEALLPDEKTHEDMTKAIIESEYMAQIWEEMKLNPKDISKIATGPECSLDSFNSWEAILSEIITGDALGMDRVDYLL
jgi:HD superfamily phosphohydrolase